MHAPGAAQGLKPEARNSVRGPRGQGHLQHGAAWQGLPWEPRSQELGLDRPLPAQVSLCRGMSHSLHPRSPGCVCTAGVPSAVPPGTVG